MSSVDVHPLRPGAYTHNEEPSLDQLLNEPIIRLMMAWDGVEVETLRALLIAASAHGRS